MEDCPTFSIQRPSHMMYLGIPIRILPIFTRPRNHLIHKPLLRWLLWWESPQDTQQLPLVLRVHAPFCLVEHINKVAS